MQEAHESVSCRFQSHVQPDTPSRAQSQLQSREPSRPCSSSSAAREVTLPCGAVVPLPVPSQAQLHESGSTSARSPRSCVSSRCHTQVHTQTCKPAEPGRSSAVPPTATVSTVLVASPAIATATLPFEPAASSPGEVVVTRFA